MRNLPEYDQDKLIQLIQRGWGLKILKITPFRHVYRLETNLGIRFFKPFHLDEAKLQLIAAAKEHLIQKGFTQCIPFISTLDGKPYLRHGKQLFYLTKWQEGHPCNYDNPFELRKSIKLFAKFHTAAREFSSPTKIPDYLGEWPNIFQERFDDLKKCRETALNHAQSSCFEKFFLNKIDFYISEGKKSIALLSESQYHSVSKLAKKVFPFCHHDPVHHNILINGSNQTVLIDFDYLIQDLHLHDLASLIIRNGKSSKWNLKRCEFILKAYYETLPVTWNELKIIQAFITFPYDIWFLARARYIEKKPLSLNYCIKELERKTRFENERQVFLHKFLDLM